MQCCPEVACIRVDFEKATYHAARHLLSLGHTRIGYLGGPEATEMSNARRKGLEDALNEAGLDLHPEWMASGFPNVAGGFQAMSALLSLPVGERPTAVQCYNDLMALGALKSIRAHHLQVPEDISVVGFDDIAAAAHANPPLTTVEQPKGIYGQPGHAHAARADGPPPGAGRRVYIIGKPPDRARNHWPLPGISSITGWSHVTTR